jgi:anti-sigma-K factor RskA
VTPLLIAAVLVVSGCANNVRTRYPSTASDATGTLVLALTRSASDVMVAVNGVLVVEDAHTEHVVIEGVPVGTAEVVMAANGADKAFRVWVGSERPTTVPLGVPDASTSFIKSLAGSLLTIVVYSLLRR